jgi:DNA-binding NtrC family response regulator
MPLTPILIVDDEPIARESLRDWLEYAGYKVVTAETGEQAIELIAKRDFSVIILDVRLPGRTGIAVLKEIKEKKPDTKAIIITAYPTSDLTAEALRLGAIDYLVKPIVPDDLERLVREATRSAQAKTRE